MSGPSVRWRLQDGRSRLEILGLGIRGLIVLAALTAAWAMVDPTGWAALVDRGSDSVSGVVLAAASPAQTGPALPWWTLDGGGQVASGSGYRLAATAGQPDSGVAAGGAYGLSGGFWVGAGLGRPAAPADLACKATPATGPGWRVELRWADGGSDISHRIERSANGGDDWETLEPDQPPGSTTFTDGNLPAGVAFLYRLQAIRGSDGARSETAGPVVCPTLTRPPAPHHLSCETDFADGAWFADLRWLDEALDESAYAIERSENGTDWQELEPRNGPNLTIHRDTPPADRELHYRVRAYRDSDDQYSDYSSVARCGTTPRPPAPAELSCRAVVQPDQRWTFELSWAEDPGEVTGYEIWRQSTSASPWGMIGTAKGKTDFEHRDLRWGEFLRYRVRAWRESPYQVSAYSNSVECAARLPRLPIVLLPGAGGSILESCHLQPYVAPPMPELLDFFQIGFCFLDPWDERCVLALKPVLFDYSERERVWLGGWGAFYAIAEPLSAKDDRYFMSLRLSGDGETAHSDFLGRRPCLRVPPGKAGILMKGPFDAVDIYAGMVTFLNAQGYHETARDGQPPNLYFFPYDFRRDLSATAPALDAVIDEALAANGTEQVDLIGHSMGGLVARNYLLHPDYGPRKVRQVISIGTPFLGAPKLVGALQIGDNLGIAAIQVPSWVSTPFSIIFGDFLELNPKVTRAIVQNWPGTYQLAPTEAFYFEPESGRWARPIREINLVGRASVKDLTYEESAALLKKEHNADVYATAEAFHRQGVGDLSRGQDTYTQHVIVGYRRPSPGRLVIRKQILCAAACIPYISRTMEKNLCGDGTVPLHSALGSRSWGVFARNGIHGAPYAEHMAMPQDVIVWSHIERALRGWPEPKWPWPTATPDAHGRHKACSQQPPPGIGIDLRPTPTPALAAAGGIRPAQVPPAPQRDYEYDSATRVELIGDGALHIWDAAGRYGGAGGGPDSGLATRGPVSPDIAFSLGEHGAVAILDPGTYTVAVHGTQPGANVQLRIAAIEDGALGRSLNYPPLAITMTSATTLTLRLVEASLPPNPPALSFRYLPHLPPKTHQPVDLAVDDVVPPETYLTVQADLVYLRGEDEPGGSGIDRILYATAAEPTRLITYNGPFPLPPGGVALAVAIDRAGNADGSPATWPPQTVATATATPTRQGPVPSATPDATVSGTPGRPWLTRYFPLVVYDAPPGESLPTAEGR